MVSVAVLLLSGCEQNDLPNASIQTAIAEMNARPNAFPDYPQPNRTYLSFSLAHGFQVNFFAGNGRAYLWYPGNRNVVAEAYKLDVVAGQQALCWRHPENSFNPVTRTTGGQFRCESLAMAQRTMAAVVAGDPYRLSEGNIPYVLDKCVAPEEFVFDRNRFSCSMDINAVVGG
ncbi:MAG: hypothetical protein AAGI09_11205 [Pseudomonadota bacterium]